jgi:L-seryl-tRNA(Ser) seleniumtransferase
LRPIRRKPAELRTVAVQAAQIIAERLETGFRVEVTEANSQVGSGSLPAESLPSVAVTITHPDISANAIAARFRRARIIGRVGGDAFHLDMRTIEDAAVFAVNLKS